MNHFDRLKRLWLSLLVTFALAFAIASSRAQLNFTDNFNSSSVDAAKWIIPDRIVGAGRFDQADHQLAYYTTGPLSATEDEQAVRFSSITSSYPEDWSAQVDVHLPALNLFVDQETWLGIGVFSDSNFGNHCSIELNLSHHTEGLYRSFFCEITRDGTQNDLDTRRTGTISLTPALRVRWEAAAQKLYAEFDSDGAIGGYHWVELNAWTIGTGPLNWGMTSSSKFRVALFAGSFGQAQIENTAGEAFDNFVGQTSGLALPSLTITSIVPLGNSLKISWRDGRGPFQLQQRSSLTSGIWENVGDPTLDMSAMVPLLPGPSFIRVQDREQ